MRAAISFLDRVDVAAPCPASWDEMTGDDRTRFCDLCRKNVYNLSDMSRREAEALVRVAGEQRTCIRFYRRPDGTVLTENCPIGLRALRDAVVRRWAVAASLIAALLHLPGKQAAANEAPKPTRRLMVTVGWIAGPRCHPRTKLPWDAMPTDKPKSGRTKHRLAPSSHMTAKRHVK